MASGCGVSSLSDIAPGANSLGSTGGEFSSASGDPKPTSTTTVASADPSLRATAASLTAVAQPGNSAYKIGPFDVLDVSVFKVPDLSKTVQVSDAGTVNLPLVGEVVAGGRTAREVEQDLTKTLGDKYLQKPQVSVLIKEYNSQRVTVEGAVKKPGVFPIQGRLTLLQALATAQGLDPNADSAVLIFREQDGKRSAARFDLSEVRGGGVADPQLQAGDVVVVSSSMVKEVWNNFLRALPIANAFAIL